MLHSSAMSRRRLRFGAVAFALAAAGIGFTAMPAAQAADPVDINLVTVNDFHGRIERDGAVRRGRGARHAPSSRSATANPNTVFAAAGDLIGASTFTSFIQKDKPTIDALNAAGLEVSSVGNHEFDQGCDDLIERVHAAGRTGSTSAPTCYDRPTASRHLPEYWTQTFEGVTIGFVGAVTDELPSLVSPAGIANLAVEAPVDGREPRRRPAQRRQRRQRRGRRRRAARPRGRGHHRRSRRPTDPGSAFGKIVNGANANIDAIVSGHTHLAYNHVINGRPVISSGQYGEKFSNMTIQVDPDTKQILSMNNVIIDTTMPGADRHVPPNYADDPAVAADRRRRGGRRRDVLGAVQLGDITADFNRAKPTPAVPTENRGGESTLGNFVADVQLWSANQLGEAADRVHEPRWPARRHAVRAATASITFAEAADVQPFANTLVTMDLTGAQVKTVLEQQWQPAGCDATDPAPRRQQGAEVHLRPHAAGRLAHHRHLVERRADQPRCHLPRGGQRVPRVRAATTSSSWPTARTRADTGKVDLQSMVDYMAAFKVGLARLRAACDRHPPDHAERRWASRSR